MERKKLLMRMKKENNMNNKINWKQKLTSRKLWVTIIGIIIGVAMSFGVGESDYGEIAGKVAGAITAISSIIGYIYGESKVDAARIDAEGIKGIIDTAEKEDIKEG